VTARILVIEDNPDNRELMRYLLTSFGYEPIVASSGHEGVEMAQAEPPDIVLLDLHMPGMDGYEAARRIRELPDLAETPIVAVTAIAMLGDRDAVLARGFDGYISKPIAPELLRSQLLEHLENANPSTCTNGP
jgi:two-component system cell cycle response regulator